MNKRQFFEYLVPQIEIVLSAYGFSYKKSKDAFVKKIPGGWIRIQFDFYKFGLFYYTNLGFEVRIDSVEEIYVQFIDMNSSGYKDTSTIVFPLGHILNINKNPKEFEFTTLSELSEIIDIKYLPFLKTKVPVFIDCYSNIEGIYNLLTNSSEENHNQIYPIYSNYVRALIIARLLNKDTFEEEIIRCKNNLLKLTDLNSSRLYNSYFDKLVTYLRGIKPLEKF